MGWSGYNPQFRITARVDAHGGDREERGERLYEQFVAEVDTAIAAIIRKPEYADPDALQLSYDAADDWVTNDLSGS